MQFIDPCKAETIALFNAIKISFEDFSVNPLLSFIVISLLPFVHLSVEYIKIKKILAFCHALCYYINTTVRMIRKEVK